MNGTRLGWRLTLSLLALSGCGDDDGTGPNEAVAGSYSSTAFTVTRPGGEPEDVLAAGGIMLIHLTAEGTTTGTLDIPASITGEEPINESMEGTFTLTGNTLQFEQIADTIIPELVWTIGPGTLSTSRTTADGTIEITLTALQEN